MKAREDLGRRTWIRLALTPVVTCELPFYAAGDVHWLAGWLSAGLMVAMQFRILLKLRRISPDLLVERSRIGPGTKWWDKVLMPLIGPILPGLTWVVAGLDRRYGWTAPFAPPVQVAGFVAAAAPFELIARSMIANRFFAMTVRIQKDRGHRVISTGPYQTVRHPGYVGMSAFTMATPLALGSRSALIPAALCAVLFVLRTALEDRTLRAELPGYAEYARRVRWRLIPGVW